MNQSFPTHLMILVATAAFAASAQAQEPAVTRAQARGDARIQAGEQAISLMPLNQLHANEAVVGQRLQVAAVDALKAAALQATASQAQAELSKLASASFRMKGGEYLVKLSSIGYKIGKIEKTIAIQEREFSMHRTLLMKSLSDRLDLYEQIFILNQNVNQAILQTQTDLSEVLDSAAEEKDLAKQQQIMKVASGLVSKLVVLKSKRPAEAQNPSIDDVIAYDESSISRISALLSDEIRDQAKIEALNIAKAKLEKELDAERSLRETLVSTMTRVSKSLGVDLTAAELVTPEGMAKLSDAAVQKAEEGRALQESLRTEMSKNVDLNGQLEAVKAAVATSEKQLLACQAQVKTYTQAVQSVRTNLATYHDKWAVNSYGRYSAIDSLEAGLNQLVPVTAAGTNAPALKR